MDTWIGTGGTGMDRDGDWDPHPVPSGHPPHEGAWLNIRGACPQPCQSQWAGPAVNINARRANGGAAMLLTA